MYRISLPDYTNLTEKAFSLDIWHTHTQTQPGLLQNFAKKTHQTKTTTKQKKKTQDNKFSSNSLKVPKMYFLTAAFFPFREGWKELLPLEPHQ